MVKAADGGVLGGQVGAGGRGVLYKVRHVHLVRGVDDGVPVGDDAHTRTTVTELLTEGAILGVGVAAAVGVVEGHVQEEGSVWNIMKGELL